MTTKQAALHTGYGATTTAREAIGDTRLDGKIAIVTGGYVGVGLETTRALAGAGATVIVPARTAGVANRVRQDCNIRCKLRCNHKVVFTLFVGTPAQPSPGWVTACHRDTVETFEVRVAFALKGTTFRSLVSSVAFALKGTTFSSLVSSVASALKGTSVSSLVSSVAFALKGTSFSSSADYRR